MLDQQRGTRNLTERLSIYPESGLYSVKFYTFKINVVIFVWCKNGCCLVFFYVLSPGWWKRLKGREGAIVSLLNPSRGSFNTGNIFHLEFISVVLNILLFDFPSSSSTVLLGETCRTNSPRQREVHFKGGHTQKGKASRARKMNPWKNHF